MSTEPQYPIGAVDRTLSALELLARQPEVRLADVRGQLDIGQSTAHRLMAMLVHRGYAEQNPHTRGYRAGPALFDIGRASSDAAGVAQIVRPVLEWLAEVSGETVHLGTLSGLNVRYLDVIESSAALRVTGRVGRLSPAHATSMGKAILATFDDARIRQMYGASPLNRVTERTVTDLRALRAELSRTRARGWARNREELESGVCSVGVALVHPTGVLLGGLSIAVPKARSTVDVENRHVELLRGAISKVFSWAPAGNFRHSALQNE